MSRFYRKQKGFTLIEVVAGLMILAIGLLAIAAMQIASIRGTYFSSHINRATIFAQDKMESLKNLPYRDFHLNAGQHDEETIPGTLFTRTVQVVEDAGNSMKTITVTVKWADRGPHTLSLSTIRSK